MKTVSLTKKQHEEVKSYHGLRVFIFRITSGVRRILSSYKYEDKRAKNREYSFIPSNTNYLMTIHQILLAEDIKFDDKIIDLGCGVSPVLLYLQYIGFKKLYGLDNEEKFLNALSNISGNAFNTVLPFKANLKRLTKANKDLIKECKVVYTYMPLQGTDVFHKYIKKIWNLISPGTVFITFYGMNHDTINIKYRVKVDKGDYEAFYFKK